MKIVIKNLQQKIPVNPSRIKKVVLRALSFEGAKNPGEITFCFVDDKRIKELNLKYLGKDCPTDVVAFDILGNGAPPGLKPRACFGVESRPASGSRDKKNLKHILADIVISSDRAIYNARIFKTSPQYELYLYVVHGLLHILGYDDRKAKQRRIMDERTAHILSELNIKPTK